MCMILPYAATLSQSRFSHAGATFWLSSFELRGWAIRSSRRIRVRGFGCVIPGRGVATRDASSRGVIQVRVWVLSSCTVQASRGLIEHIKHGYHCHRYGVFARCGVLRCPPVSGCAGLHGVLQLCALRVQLRRSTILGSFTAIGTDTYLVSSRYVLVTWTHNQCVRPAATA
ncbi:hypothetical protein L226DRAFT_265195 [Lentinus tigrinus ALCF2SS1-7]|uniref:uncharacterized protein n=1 Tax=Lentinus tigrinus ALCF2SS1-7 TaxID=1328758 RepID=UPI001165F643|nr:hypothetical protein L226DRAFT_265195 [Lentinus tigrinus ALCF2SS1-7]